MVNETRIATWKGAPGLTSRPAKEKLGNFIYPIKAILAVALGLPILGVLLGAFSSWATFEYVFVFATLPVCAIAAFGVYVYHRYNDFAEPMPVYDHGDLLPRMNVLIRLAVEGHEYGSDRGELTLVDDWLVFEGAQTTFSLAPHDVSVLLRGVREFGREPVGLRMKQTGADVQLWILADDPHSDLRSFLEWWRVKTVPVPSISVLPPLVPMPGIDKRRFLPQANGKDASVRKTVSMLLPLYVFGMANMSGLFTKFHPAFDSLVVAVVFAVGLLFWADRRASRRSALSRLASAHATLASGALTSGLPLIPPLHAAQIEAESQKIRQ